MSKVTKIIEEQKKAIGAEKLAANVDKKCPFTGGLKLRQKTFTGIVVSKDTHKTAQVEWNWRKFLPKYERFMVSKTKVSAHNPAVINAEVGDIVIIAECRPISKTKNFVIIQNLGMSKEYIIKKDLIEDDMKVAEEGRAKHLKKDDDESEKDDQ